MRPQLAQLQHKVPEVALGRIVDRVLQRDAVLLVVLLLDAHQVQLVPVHAHEAGDEQLVAQLVVLVVRRDVAQRVLQQERVARGLVDDAIEDVCDDFAL